VRSKAALLALLAAGCGGRLARPEAAVPLAYRDAPGQVRRWRVEDVLRGKIALGGMAQLVVVTLRGTVTETVEAVRPDGWTRLRVRFAFEPPDFNGLPMPDSGEPREAVVRFLRSPSGETRSADGERATGDALAWAGRILGGVAPALPPAAVRPGESWSAAQALPLAGGSLAGTSRASLAGFESAGGRRCAVIAEEGDLSLAAPPPGGAVTAFRLTYAGRSRFDPAGGRLVDAARQGTLRLTARRGRTPVEALVRFASTLTPAP